ncbi:MAG: hypothetical protein NTY35_00205 [Planctomycetota bacterium]|nr:hypothetical protein [Planctomycetota bacterium]
MAALSTTAGPPKLSAPAVPTALATPAPTGAEAILAWSALRNGGFEERGSALSPPAIPWWRSSHGASLVETDPGGASRLRTGPGEHAEQPIAAYAPLVDRFRVTGTVRGAGLVSITDGGGGVARFPVRSSGDEALRFEITAADLARELGHAPVPRFTLRLAGDGDGVARWDDVAASVVLPLPSEAELRAEVIAELDAIFSAWEQRALDVAGPRKTAFVARSFDIVTGGELGPVQPAPAFFPLQENLLDAVAAHDEPRWRAFLERYLEDVLTLALHPTTGLPCLWNASTDERVDDVPVEIALPLGFLIDVAREGPESFRARARAAAVKIGETVLANGLLPDGEVAASYVPRTGAPNTNVSRLRRLDVPCQLARLAALTGEDRYAKPARVALGALEFTNHWAGTWDAIDPAFDDDFGHYGARSATIARALPADVLFRRFALEGLRHFLPLWRDATRFGGNVAADQVRCWRVAADLALVDPSLRAELEPALFDAVHAHVQGEQYGNGAWGDVTIFGYSPKTGLQVGDLPGTPQNLLNGLSAAYTADLGLRTELTRALYTAVLRSSVTEYRKPYGFLLGRTANARGGNNAAGSLRVLLGLTTMLRGLPK